MQKNLNGLQILRAIAAMLVVVWHSRLAIKNTTHNYWVEGDAIYRSLHFPAFVNHLDLGVDIFFCISGFIMCMLIQKMPSTIESAVIFLKRRAIRIFPPYWFFTLLVVLIFFASKGSFNVGQMSGNLIEDCLRISTSILLIPQVEPPVLGVGWTLVHESMFYVLCGLSIFLKLNRRLPEVMGVMSVAAAILVYLNIALFYGYVLSPFYIEFFFGALACALCDRWGQAVKFSTLFIFAGFVCFVVTSYILDTQTMLNTTSIVRQIGGGLVGFLLITGLIGLDKKYSVAKTVCGLILMRVGDASYTLYLVHWFVLSLMGKILIGLAPDAPVYLLAAWHVASMLMSIVVAVFLSEKFEMPFHRWLSFRLSIDKPKVFR